VLVPHERDDLLVQIEQKYQQLAALHFTRGRVHQTAAYQALMKEIRALVDQRTKLRGNEMIVALEKAPNFKT
jgi:hypothetical protein